MSLKSILFGVLVGLTARVLIEMVVQAVALVRRPRVTIVDVSAEWLEDFASMSHPLQQRYIVDQRRLDNMKIEIKRAEKRRSEQIEERWKRVPMWRRAVVLMCQAIQRRVTPGWFQGLTGGSQ